MASIIMDTLQKNMEYFTAEKLTIKTCDGDFDKRIGSAIDDIINEIEDNEDLETGIFNRCYIESKYDLTLYYRKLDEEYVEMYLCGKLRLPRAIYEFNVNVPEPENNELNLFGYKKIGTLYDGSEVYLGYDGILKIVLGTRKEDPDEDNYMVDDEYKKLKNLQERFVYRFNSDE